MLPVSVLTGYSLSSSSKLSETLTGLVHFFLKQQMQDQMCCVGMLFGPSAEPDPRLPCTVPAHYSAASGSREAVSAGNPDPHSRDAPPCRVWHSG